MTNRDKINNMTNEELALFLSKKANELAYCTDCVFINKFCEKCEQSVNGCENMICKWLEQEVEE